MRRLLGTVALLVGCARSHAVEAPPPPPAEAAGVLVEGLPELPPAAPPPAETIAPESAPVAPRALVDADGKCIDDDTEPDDETDVNQRASWMAAGKDPSERVACPGDTDYTQGSGDFTMEATVTWDPKLGALDVALVEIDGRRYQPRTEPYNQGESIAGEPGRWSAIAGNHHEFIRVRNGGKKPIPYTITVTGAWAE